MPFFEQVQERASTIYYLLVAYSVVQEEEGPLFQPGEGAAHADSEENSNNASRVTKTPAEYGSSNGADGGSGGGGGGSRKETGKTSSGAAAAVNGQGAFLSSHEERRRGQKQGGK